MWQIHHILEHQKTIFIKIHNRLQLIRLVPITIELCNELIVLIVFYTCTHSFMQQ